MQIRLLQLAVYSFALSGCIDRHTNTPAFYVWKSKLSAEDADTAYLNTLGVQKIYARMFDVDNKGNGAFPTADYSPSSGNPDFQQEVVPVIFITNQTILQCPAADIEKLARNCADRIDTVYRSHFNKLPNEYQFDCDWTVKTKENYFNFLKHIRKLRKGALVSCTIRLHQIKFKDKTGIPPVDKGTLMYYASQRKEIAGLSSSLQAEIPQLYFDVDRDKVKLAGVPMADVFSTMKAYTGSVYVNDFNMFNRIYRVYIQAEADYREHPENINFIFRPRKQQRHDTADLLRYDFLYDGTRQHQTFSTCSTVPLSGEPPPTVTVRGKPWKSSNRWPASICRTTSA